ncbi:hypothetical protein WN944_009429 [Citrus x changshan-huyou]|uniref:Uncharacterized protein n=1 Tax=Citrus x changshan-huyou TaxID=2935761 RepID=A0AAP0QS22_9ROSI
MRPRIRTRKRASCKISGRENYSHGGSDNDNNDNARDILLHVRGLARVYFFVCNNRKLCWGKRPYKEYLGSWRELALWCMHGFVKQA